MDRQPATAAYESTRGQRAWMLTLLVAIYTSNFVDRTIVGILQQPIKEELALQDWQLGLLGGTAFAIFYTLMGVPVARLAERGDRITVLSVCIVIWSGFTALCGAVSTFAQLLLLRIGVAIGEAGATPTSHSLISDFYTPAKRPAAIAIFASGNTIGTVIGALLGATVGAAWGWRWAFVVAGAPGILLAILAWFTLRDPRRNVSFTRAPDSVPPLKAAAATLFGKRTFRQLLIGSSLMLFGSYAAIHFATPHMMRTFSLGLGAASMIGGVGTGLALGFGTIAGAFLAQRLAVRDRRWLLWTVAIAMLFAAPLCLLAFLSPDLGVAVTFFILMMVMIGVFQGPVFGTLHSLVQPRMRATATALMLLVVTLFGLGLGPLVAGIASDQLANFAYGGGGFRAACSAGASADLACQQASAFGLRTALAACAFVFAWSSIHFVLAARTLRDEVED